MARQGDGISRRDLLKRTGVTLGAIAIGGCSDDGAAAGESGDGGASGSGGTSNGTGGAAEGTGGSPAGGGGSAPGGMGGAAGATGGAPVATGGVPSATGGAPAATGGAPAAGGGATGGASGTGGAPPVGSANTLAVVGAGDLDAAVARAVQLAGGIDAIQPGQTVFIKPNAVSDRAVGTSGIRTSNETLAAVIRLVRERNPGRIIVGDRAARGFDTDRVFDVTGMAEAALAAGADEVYRAPSETEDPDAWVLLQPPGYETAWQDAGGILAMRAILEADHLINVPTCKNHRYALFTLSMKNFIGAIGDSSRDPIHYLDSVTRNFEPIGHDIAILNQAFSPLINIVDATTVVINGGPAADGADTVRLARGLILAGRDRVALDALGVSLIQLELGRTNVPEPDASNALLTSTRPWDFPQIVRGAEYGIGSAESAEAELAFDDVPDAAALEDIFRS